VQIEFKKKYKNFEVVETGWSKLDIYAKDNALYDDEKKKLLAMHKAKKLLLYAPTFSPKLTSAPYLIEPLKKLIENSDYLLLIKSHKRYFFCDL